jgi:hypothetical protein
MRRPRAEPTDWPWTVTASDRDRRGSAAGRAGSSRNEGRSQPRRNQSGPDRLGAASEGSRGDRRDEAYHLLIGSYTTIPSVFLLNARLPSSGVMHLDLSDEETLALLNLLTQTIDNDRYPLSPRIQTLRSILAKFGPMAPAPPPPARPPTPEERDPSRRPRSKSHGTGDRPRG